MEKGARREGKSVENIVDFYTTDFIQQCKAIGIDLPTGTMQPKATEYIQEQMILALELVVKEMAYLLEDGIYFDSDHAEEFFKEQEISEPLKSILITQAKQQAGNSSDFTGRDIKNSTKNSGDFALWKFVEESSLQKWRMKDFEKTAELLAVIQEQISVDGFERLLSNYGCPGWHSECVAMICALSTTTALSQIEYISTDPEGTHPLAPSQEGEVVKGEGIHSQITPFGLAANFDYTTNPFLYYLDSLKEKARIMRNNLTKYEEIFYDSIKQNTVLKKYDWNRQKPIGTYIVDFYCRELKLIIEIDGEIHNTEYNKLYD
jgi:hypothetical protein